MGPQKWPRFSCRYFQMHFYGRNAWILIKILLKFIVEAELTIFVRWVAWRHICNIVGYRAKKPQWENKHQMQQYPPYMKVSWYCTVWCAHRSVKTHGNGNAYDVTILWSQRIVEYTFLNACGCSIHKSFIQRGKFKRTATCLPYEPLSCLLFENVTSLTGVLPSCAKLTDCVTDDHQWILFTGGQQC